MISLTEDGLAKFCWWLESLAHRLLSGRTHDSRSVTGSGCVM